MSRISSILAAAVLSVGLLVAGCSSDEILSVSNENGQSTFQKDTGEHQKDTGEHQKDTGEHQKDTGEHQKDTGEHQ